MHSNNYEWFITQTVEAMLPCFHDRNICLAMKIKMHWNYYPLEQSVKQDNINRDNFTKTFRKIVFVVFHRPTNYTKVLYRDITNVQHFFIDKKQMEMKQMSDHDSCWSSEGMKWIFESFMEAWSYFEKFGIEGRKIEPSFHYDIFHGAPAYYHLEKLEIKNKYRDFRNVSDYIVKIGKQIPVSQISQYLKEGE